MPEVEWVRAADLERWSDTRASQELLPELICRLVEATLDEPPDRIAFRSREGVVL
jgi:hypothetical protein